MTTITLSDAISAEIEQVRTAMSSEFGRPVPRTAIIEELLRLGLAARGDAAMAVGLRALTVQPPRSSALEQEAARVRAERRRTTSLAERGAKASADLRAALATRGVAMPLFARWIAARGIKVSPAALSQFWYLGKVDGLDDAEDLLAAAEIAAREETEF